MARHMGISDTSVLRIWRAHGLKPHRSETFKVSNDPLFAEKLEAVVGLYRSPPEHAIVSCVDDKSQVQVLDRTQPGLPLKRGRAETITHDYKRYGTTTLFAAMDAATGRVISLCPQRHRHQEWLKRTGRAGPAPTGEELAPPAEPKRVRCARVPQKLRTRVTGTKSGETFREPAMR